MRSSLLFLSTLASLSTSMAIPMRFPNFSLTPILPNLPAVITCDLSEATLPTPSTPLPPPSAGLSLLHVAIGRGTQNYTCADSSNTTIPAAIGAVATLYNASCIAASYPTVLSTLPLAALQLPSTQSPSSLAVSGHHYFVDTTTPAFNMGALGFTLAKKLASAPAPAGADVGQNGQGFGAVAWLKLEHETTGAVGDIMEVYRMNTAGGNPPATCAGMPSAFEVQYSAEYWFYAGSS